MTKFINLAAFMVAAIFFADFRQWQKFGGFRYSVAARKTKQKHK